MEEQEKLKTTPADWHQQDMKPIIAYYIGLIWFDHKQDQLQDQQPPTGVTWVQTLHIQERNRTFSRGPWRGLLCLTWSPRVAPHQAQLHLLARNPPCRMRDARCLSSHLWNVVACPLCRGFSRNIREKPSLDPNCSSRQCLCSVLCQAWIWHSCWRWVVEEGAYCKYCTEFLGLDRSCSYKRHHPNLIVGCRLIVRHCLYSYKGHILWACWVLRNLSSREWMTSGMMDSEGK